jgi:hypothetical protein
MAVHGDGGSASGAGTVILAPRSGCSGRAGTVAVQPLAPPDPRW